jgi:hypothetical protein
MRRSLARSSCWHACAQATLGNALARVECCEQMIVRVSRSG